MVAGNFQANSNTGGLSIDNNQITGTSSFQANNNTQAAIDVSGNTIGGNLQCLNNFSVSHIAVNMVHGSVQGQCAAFNR